MTWKRPWIRWRQHVGPNTAILPLLNGMRHMDLLKARFGDGRVLGGLCMISTVLDPEGRVLHLNDLHALSFGEPDGVRSSRIEAVATALSDAGFDARLSNSILQDMWEKSIFIATGAGATCLMRASIGDIVAAGAEHVVTALLDESTAIAAAGRLSVHGQPRFSAPATAIPNPDRR